MLTEYSPIRFAELPEFQQAKASASDADYRLEPLESLIRAFRLEHRVGLALLHRHFSIGFGELLLKTQYDDHANIDVVDRLPAGAIPYLFAVAAPNFFVPVEYLESASVGFDRVNSSAQLIFGTTLFQEAFSNGLIEAGLEEIFGLVLLHAPSLPKGDVFVETTDVQNRKLFIQARSTLSFDADGITQTLWTFSGVGPSVCAHVCLEESHQVTPPHGCNHVCAHVCLDATHNPPEKATPILSAL